MIKPPAVKFFEAITTYENQFGNQSSPALPL